MWHCSNVFKTDENQLVAKKLVDRTFADSVFFCNSGAEAVDTGIKMIRKYFKDRNNCLKWKKLLLCI